MTAEHLLDAIGLLDDDLIQDAEARPAPVIPLRVRVRRWGSWAACIALVVVLGYGVTHLGMGGSSSASTSASAGLSAEASPSSGADAAWDSSAPASSGSAGDSANPSAGQEEALIYLATGTYALTGDILDALPEGCVPLGSLSQLSPDSPAPSTDGEEYVGCELWAADENPIPDTVYVLLPEGGCAPAELVQP